jgi:uncharacterized protein
MNERRSVCDTNVVVSAALLPLSITGQVLSKAQSEGYLLISEATANEAREVLSRPKFDKYLSKGDRLEFLDSLIQKAIPIEITVAITACRDPKDNKFLELAISGTADCIVSGDQDLLILHPFRGIPILSPRQFLDEIWLPSE